MKVFITILVLLVSQWGFAEQAVNLPGFGWEFEVTGDSIEELDTMAGIWGAHRCSGMFYGFGVLHSLENISVEENKSFKDPLVGKYVALCAFEPPQL